MAERVGALPSKEIPQHPLPVTFYKVGGTWDMVEKGKTLVGSGNLDDHELESLETETFNEATPLRPRPSPVWNIEGRLPVFNPAFNLGQIIDSAEQALSKKINSRMRSVEPIADIGEHLASWARDEDSGEQIKDYITGPFLPIYSGDSSHLRPALTTPIVSILIEQALREPHKPVLGAQGTDAADVAFLPLLDVLTFDTPLPPFIFTGANRSHNEEGSDAPRNFLDLAHIARLDLTRLHKSISEDAEIRRQVKPFRSILRPGLVFDALLNRGDRVASGAFWVFHNFVYPASDFVKVDPQETRTIEGQSTFFSPHQTAVRKLVEEGLWGNLLETNWQHRQPPRDDHIVNSLSMEKLFAAQNQVATIDLTDNPLPSEQIRIITDDRFKAVVIAGHGLGNVSNMLRTFIPTAVEMGKLVIAASRHLVGEVTPRYGASILAANFQLDPRDIKGRGMVISGERINKTVAQALATRAILEGMNSYQTQFLIDLYCYTRNLHPAYMRQ